MPFSESPLRLGASIPRVHHEEGDEIGRSSQLPDVDNSDRLWGRCDGCRPLSHGIWPDASERRLKQMEIALEGNPSPREIRRLLDRALEVTDTPINADSYLGGRECLVSVSEEFGATEMEMLRCMPVDHVTHAWPRTTPSLSRRGDCPLLIRQAPPL
jgi:hypothetical protein